MSHFMGLEVFINLTKAFFYSYTFNMPKFFINKILVTFIFLLVYRIGSYIPLIGIDTEVLTKIYFLESSQSILFDNFNFLVGGSLGRISIFALNLIPYLSASLIINLFVSSNRQLKKKSPSKKISIWIQLTTIFIALIQSIGIVIFLKRINHSFYERADCYIIIEQKNNIYFDFLNILTLIAGTLVLQWIAQKITQYGFGNGVSLILILGIVSEVSKSVWKIDFSSKLLVLFIFMLIFYLVFLIEQTSISIPIISMKAFSIWHEKQRSSYYFLSVPINIFGLMPLIIYQIFYYFVIASKDVLLSFFEVKEYIPSIIIQIIILVMSCLLIKFVLMSELHNKEIFLSLKRHLFFTQGLYLGKEVLYYFNNILNVLIGVNFLYFFIISTIPEILFDTIYHFYAVEYNINGITIFLIAKITISTIKQVKSNFLLEIPNKITNKKNIFVFPSIK